MRNRIIGMAVAALGLVGIPAFAQANRAPERGHVEVRDTRPVEHVQRDVRDDHRDVRIDNHVVIDHRDRDWDHRRVDIVPAPLVTIDVAPQPYTDVAVAVNQVPAAVLNAVSQQTGGAAIASVNYLSGPGGQFYDVTVVYPNQTTQTLRFGILGGFVGSM